MKKVFVVFLLIPLIAVGAVAYHVNKPTEQTDKIQVAQTIDAPVAVVPVAETVTPVVDTAQPANVTAEPTPTVVAPVATVVTRTFDQIILDYPNMSSTEQRLACSAYIRDTFAYRFTPDVIEVNVKLVSDRFVDSCTAVGSDSRNPKPTLLSATLGLGDFWERFKS